LVLNKTTGKGKRSKKMPLGDKTGPRGQGPRTGRGLGSCPPGETAYQETQPGDPILGIGRGLRKGIGARRREWGEFRNPWRRW